VSEPSDDSKAPAEPTEADASEKTADEQSLSSLSLAPDVVPDLSSVSEPTSPPTATPTLAATAKPPAKRGNLFILALVAVAGAVVVTVITCDIFEQKLPDFLQPFEPTLDKHVRYSIGYGTGAKDWRNELVIEQSIWSSEVNKIRLAQTNAKPEMFKRDFLFYLADSYYRDEPHFREALAAYLAGAAEPYVAHTPGYNILPSELDSKIGYSAMRCGLYSEAEKYLKEAVSICDTDQEPTRKMVNGGRANFCLDVLAECEIRQGHLAEAQNIINERLKRIKLPSIDATVESYLLFNNAMLLEKQGKFTEAETYYKRAIAQHAQDDKIRGALEGSSKDNNRMLAYVLREYARFLRTQKRADESFNVMDRAVSIMNNAP
jgi:tetratricopeptide (TPR) repeat protein